MYEFEGLSGAKTSAIMMIVRLIGQCITAKVEPASQPCVFLYWNSLCQDPCCANAVVSFKSMRKQHFLIWGYCWSEHGLIQASLNACSIHLANYDPQLK